MGGGDYLRTLRRGNSSGRARQQRQHRFHLVIGFGGVAQHAVVFEGGAGPLFLFVVPAILVAGLDLRPDKGTHCSLVGRFVRERFVSDGPIVPRDGGVKDIKDGGVGERDMVGRHRNRRVVYENMEGMQKIGERCVSGDHEDRVDSDTAKEPRLLGTRRVCVAAVFEDAFASFLATFVSVIGVTEDDPEQNPEESMS